MTTIILTIIGILLAAAAALMVIFYGGDAFNSGSVGAQANTYQNAGTNVIAAVQLYKADGNTISTANPLTLAALQSDPNGTGAYLKDMPALPAKADGSASTLSFTNTQASVTGVSDAVCTRINKNLKLPSTAATGAVKMGCFTNKFEANF